jgi:radical SAM/Cys-rich protein
MLDTLPLLRPSDFPSLSRRKPGTLQVNLGYKCNQRCLHCHVAASPDRKEIMTAQTIEEVIGCLDRPGFETLDLTGGAPELNPGFRHLVEAARARGSRVIDRCNLTVLNEPGQEDLAEFLALQGVEIVASLPCYLEENVDRQRGKGVFDASLLGLRRLNALGYGDPAGTRVLNLVYNPQDAALPPPQDSLQSGYKRILSERYGVRFNRLLALTNLPIRRFGSTLLSKGMFDDYMQLLKGAFAPANLEAVMCRDLLSVDWQGYLYDCDFNQMLGLGLRAGRLARPHLRDLPKLVLEGNRITVADHCYGCTAGQGSSCGGALSADDAS